MCLRTLVCISLIIAFICSAKLVDGQEPDRRDVGRAIGHGQLLYAQQEWAKAIEKFGEAIRLDAKSSAAFEWRATARLQIGEWDKAIKDFDEAIRLDRKLGSTFSNRGFAWQMKGDSDRAMADYTEAIRINPKYAQAFHNRGTIQSNRGEWDKAIADYTEALRLNPKYQEALDGRGIVWRLKGEYEKSLADYDKVIELNPKFRNSLFNRAWLRATCPDAKFRDGAKAVKDAMMAFELAGKKLPSQLDILAAAHAEAGQFEEAVKWQKKALEDESFAKEHGVSARNRLKLYEAKKPFRESPPSKTPR